MNKVSTPEADRHAPFTRAGIVRAGIVRAGIVRLNRTEKHKRPSDSTP